MGFDLSGLNPEAKDPEPTWDRGNPWISDGDGHRQIIDPQIKEEFDDYMKSKMKWQEENEGSYFRSNVWYWRPLWTFVCRTCDDILTAKDEERGNYNDGHKISKTKTKRMASRLRRYLKNGHVEAYEAWYSKETSKLDDKDWKKNYPFSIEHVKEFERFCEKSGGFEIW